MKIAIVYNSLYLIHHSKIPHLDYIISRGNSMHFIDYIPSPASRARWPQALQLFESLPHWVLRADAVSHGSALSGCALGRQWRKALWLLTQRGRGQGLMGRTPSVLNKGFLDGFSPSCRIQATPDVGSSNEFWL